MHRYCLILLLLAFPLFGDQLLDKAAENYQSGLHGDTLAEREAGFNQTLSLLMQLKEQNAIDEGALNFWIGNTFFHLKQYPEALYYYYQAKELKPRDQNLEYNIEKTLRELGLERQRESILQKSFFSVPEKLQLFSLFLILGLILISLWIWTRLSWTMSSSIFFFLLSLFLFINVMYVFYFSPIKGVVTHSTLLYREAQKTEDVVSQVPILTGQMVRVIDVVDEGKWLKVLLEDGTVGFLPASSLRLI